jgi:ribonuclease-3
VFNNFFISFFYHHRTRKPILFVVVDPPYTLIPVPASGLVHPMPPTPHPAPEDLEKILGYSFHNPELLIHALTYRPSADENFTKNENFMEPLATVGDAVLGAVVGYHVYEDGNREKGTLTVEKIRKIKHYTNRKFAEKLRLREYIRRNDPEGEAWAKSSKAPEMVLEALIGAVFLDVQQNGANGMDSVREMLGRLGYFG